MRVFKVLTIFILITLYSSSILLGQESGTKANDGTIYTFGIGMGANVPFGDLKKRYGSNLNFSLGGDIITKKNWIFNAEFMYLFGTNIKEDVLSSLRTSDGLLLGDDSQIVDIILKERGLFLGGGIGKLFSTSTVDRSGIKAVFQVGVLQHKINFADERNSLAQLRAGRNIGYDRLSRGLAIKQSIAYKHLSLDRRLNFELALDCMEGFTSEVRAINFDTGLPTIKSRLDILIGLKFLWNIPIYTGSKAVIYY